MARNKPQLKVITGSPEKAERVGEFRIAALNELSSSQRGFVERVVSQICPKAGILGVVVEDNHWDLRPVVVFPSESCPSLLRFLGPDVTLSETLRTRVDDTFKHLKGYSDLSSQLLEHGLYEEQIWYRRRLVDFTLDKILSESEYITYEQAQLLSRNLVQHTENLHARGIVHGHIVPSNVSVIAGGDTVLIDVGVGIAQFQASNERVEDEDFAPEVFTGEALPFSADVYGLGLTLKELLKRVSLRDEEGNFTGERDERARRYIDICNNMLQNDPARRPSLTRVKQIFLSNRKSSPRKRKRTLTRSIPRGQILTGKNLLHSDQPAEKQFTEEGSTEGRSTEKNAEERKNETFRLERKESVNEREIVKEALKLKPSETEADQKPVESKETAKDEGHQAGPQSAEVASEEDSSRVVVQNEPLDASLFDDQVMREIEAEREARRKASEKKSQEKTPREEKPEPIEEPPQAATDEAIDQEWTEPVEEFQENKRLQDKENWRIGDVKPESDSERVSALVRYFVLLVFVACAGVIGYRFTSGSSEPVEVYSYEREQLLRLWESHQPSQMSQVALEAITLHSDNRSFAETLIVGSAIRGEPLPEFIDVSLLRIAFDPRWERELRVGDRRAAIALSTFELLTAQIPEDIPTIDKLHPGVLLALTVTAKRGTKALRKISMKALIELPPPIAPAFAQLAEDPAAKSLDDYPVRYVANLATKGLRTLDFNTVERLNEFIAENTIVRLKALALLFSQDEATARALVRVLLSHPNLQPQHEYFAWGRKQSLADWESKDFSSADQLFVLAGVPPTGKPRKQDFGGLFSHPAPKMRSYAIKEALNSFSFGHPGAVPIFRRLLEEPELLSAEQTLQLATILQVPSKVGEDYIIDWLKTKPQLALVETLLRSTVNLKEPLKMDFQLARYLNLNNWSPSMRSLRALINHPEPLVRMLVYTKLTNHENTKIALKLLKEAQKTEKVNEYQKALDSWVRGLEPL